jgi:hypothetical protein
MERVYPSNIAREREDSKQTCEKKLWEKNNYNEVFFFYLIMRITLQVKLYITYLYKHEAPRNSCKFLLILSYCKNTILNIYHIEDHKV